MAANKEAQALLAARESYIDARGALRKAVQRAFKAEHGSATDKLKVRFVDEIDGSVEDTFMHVERYDESAHCWRHVANFYVQGGKFELPKQPAGE